MDLRTALWCAAPFNKHEMVVVVVIITSYAAMKLLLNDPIIIHYSPAI